ncbi:hypothetical protein [Streptomyces sp. S.PB5]|uniref:hypothetical protein n=1 Tax=Streptomyces sp. S.PB5 TaxID=3020844 RepID=UPI0025B268E4|nr:hypothetical protein [Streptomyces sp. S.PB5]MDN3027945.1 hypothetical protein [Streptomyces sp. S.PB5]
MPGLRGFLARWRPAESPGPAVGGAVPMDRSVQLTAELGPVLALLDDAAAQAAALRDTAAHEAAERRRAAAEEADRTLRAARARAMELRTETASRRRAQAVTEATHGDAAARHAVRELRARARARTPDLAARVVARVTRELTPDTPCRRPP